jgi:hypothetical protein
MNARTENFIYVLQIFRPGDVPTVLNLKLNPNVVVTLNYRILINFLYILVSIVL